MSHHPAAGARRMDTFIHDCRNERVIKLRYATECMFVNTVAFEIPTVWIGEHTVMRLDQVGNTHNASGSSLCAPKEQVDHLIAHTVRIDLHTLLYTSVKHELESAGGGGACKVIGRVVSHMVSRMVSRIMHSCCFKQEYNVHYS